MSRIALTFALALLVAPVAGAQMPDGPALRRGPGPGMEGGRPGAAAMLLSQTADLKLSDAQVTRLAAIARRTAERRAANRGALDSLRVQMRPSAQGGAPQGPPAAARAFMERVRTQEHEDLRDALSVLTPDQQAMAWERVARHAMQARAGGGGAARMRQMAHGRRGGMGAGGGMGHGMMGPGMMGPGPGQQPGARGMRAPNDSARRPLRQPARRPDQQ